MARKCVAFFGGVPRQIVPDKLRSGVPQSNWYEPGINPNYRDLAARYGTAILVNRGPLVAASLAFLGKESIVRRRGVGRRGRSMIP